MPSFILKVAKDKDAYVEWSTIVDNATRYFESREDAIRQGVAPQRLDRADQTGTSFIEGTWYGWNDDPFLVTNMEEDGFFNLQRKDLDEFSRAVCSNDFETAQKFLTLNTNE